MHAQARQIKERVGATLAFVLPLPCVGNQNGGGQGVVTGFDCGIQSRGLTGDRQVQIDPIQQRPGEFVAVALNHVRRAGTATTRLAEISTGARIHRGHQLKACGKPHAILRPGNHDMPGFQRFSQNLQHLAIKLRQFVEKQYAMVGEGDLAGLWFRTTVTSFNRCNRSPSQPAFCRMIDPQTMQLKSINRCNWPRYGY